MKTTKLTQERELELLNKYNNLTDEEQDDILNEISDEIYNDDSGQMLIKYLNNLWK